jgi:hypothetical protein
MKTIEGSVKDLGHGYVTLMSLAALCQQIKATGAFIYDSEVGWSITNETFEFRLPERKKIDGEEDKV